MYVQTRPYKTLIREDCNKNPFSGECSDIFNIRYLILEDCDKSPFGREYGNSSKSIEDIRKEVQIKPWVIRPPNPTLTILSQTPLRP